MWFTIILISVFVAYEIYKLIKAFAKTLEEIQGGISDIQGSLSDIEERMGLHEEDTP